MQESQVFKPNQAIYYNDEEGKVISYIKRVGKDHIRYEIEGYDEPIDASKLSPFSRMLSTDYQETKTFDAFPADVQIVTSIINEDVAHLGRLTMRGLAVTIPLGNYKETIEEQALLIHTLRQLHQTLQPLTIKENIQYMKGFFYMDEKEEKPKLVMSKLMGEVTSMVRNKSKLMMILKSLNMEHLRVLDAERLMALGEKYGIDLSDAIQELTKTDSLTNG